MSVLVVATAMGCGGDDSDCEDGWTKQRVCTECGLAGGCAKSADQCARSCGADAECDGLGPLVRCNQGVCQISGCV
jgi:hypothetical protein